MLCSNLESAAKASFFLIICTVVAIALVLVLLGGVTYLLERFDNFTGTHVVTKVFGFLIVILVFLSFLLFPFATSIFAGLLQLIPIIGFIVAGAVQ